MCASAALAAACSTSPAPEPEVSRVSLPSGNGVYKIGEPYEQEGIWYYPREQPEYDETGVASWYGGGFEGHRTANGEMFDADALTAAHPTLPMPVNVRVTNLENGKSLVLRVNDRGPFRRGRIIDVSRHAAQLLGFVGKGTAKVRVTYLARADEPGAEAPDSATATAIAAAPTGAVQVASLDPVAAAPVSARTAPAHAPQTDSSDVPSPSPEKLDAKFAPAPPAAEQRTASAEAPPSGQPDAKAEAPAPEKQASVEAPPPVQQQALPETPPPSEEQTIKSESPPAEERVASVESPSPVTVVPVPAVSHLYVQLGAFSVRSNADRLKNRLSAAGNLTISAIDRKGQPLYRVRIGPFDDVSAADAALAQVTGLGSSDAKIVVDR